MSRLAATALWLCVGLAVVYAPGIATATLHAAVYVAVGVTTWALGQPVVLLAILAAALTTRHHHHA